MFLNLAPLVRKNQKSAPLVANPFHAHSTKYTDTHPSRYIGDPLLNLILSCFTN